MLHNKKRCLRFSLGIILLVWAGSPAGLGAEEKTPFTIEDSLNVRTLSIADITENGRYIAATLRTSRARLGIDHQRYRDPSYITPRPVEAVILDSESGGLSPLFQGRVEARGFTWSPDGTILAYLMRKGDSFYLHTFQRESGKHRQLKLKTDKSIAVDSFLDWTHDGSGLLLSLREEGWLRNSRALFEEAATGPVTVYDSRKPFLKWDVIRDQALLGIPALVNVRTGDVRELLPEDRYSDIRLAENDGFITYIVTTPIETSYGQNYYQQGGREYSLFRLGMEPGAEPRPLIERREKRLSLRWNEESTFFAWAEEGDIFIQGVDEPEARNLTAGKVEPEVEAEAGEERADISDTEKKPEETRFSLLRFSPDGRRLLASTKRGYWLIDHMSGDLDMVYEFPEESEGDIQRGDPRPRSLAAWSPDGRFLYLAVSALDTWKRGFARYDLTERRLTDLVRDGNLYRGLEMSKDGSRFFYGFSDGDTPDDLYMTDRDFATPRRLTDLNPWIGERRLTRSELISYLDVDGKSLHGLLYYPVGYQPGKRYPLVCEIYERFFHNGFNAGMNILANQGWFVLRPSVELEVGRPGEAWIKGVTCAVNSLIERGLVDPDRLGVHGTSYGGYATSLLITQTDRFAAAINISGKVNMISFLGDSPRIGHRNYGAAETGQDRLGKTLWEAPLKYIRHSAVMFADRITTPHMLITGEGDWNVPAGNSRELYYALRRLGKECVWVNYRKAGHGLNAAADEAAYLDKWNRLLDWYATHFAVEEEPIR